MSTKKKKAEHPMAAYHRGRKDAFREAYEKVLKAGTDNWQAGDDDLASVLRDIADEFRVQMNTANTDYIAWKDK